MIKLRYLDVVVDIGFGNGKREKVLQYCIQTNLHELGLQPPIWSDWIDVPVIKE